MSSSSTPMKKMKKYAKKRVVQEDNSEAG